GIMVSGEQFLTAISSTSLLEAYIMRVLGRDDPRDSSRTGLDATNRAKLLESLANLFIMKQVGTLPEADVIAHFQEYFDLVDWDESPLEVLTFFRSRGIVQTAGGQVRFTQATYLHLLAARYAVEHESARRPFFEYP